MVVRDNDGGNCVELKQRLLAMVPQHKVRHVKIRLVIQELEAWYLGSPDALHAAGLLDQTGRDRLARDKSTRNPELLTNAKQKFKRLIGERGQIELARRIGPHLAFADNTCSSFRTLVHSIKTDW